MNDNLTRRQWLKKTGQLAISTSSLGFPSIIKAYNSKPTIRIVGTHVILQEQLRKKAQRDLGINIEFYPGGDAQVLLKASTDPSSFDLYEQWSNSLKILWQANAIQGIEIAKFAYWSEINQLTKTGRISDKARLGLGDVPHNLLYAQKDGTLGSNPYVDCTIF